MLTSEVFACVTVFNTFFIIWLLAPTAVFSTRSAFNGATPLLSTRSHSKLGSVTDRTHIGAPEYKTMNKTEFIHYLMEKIPFIIG